MALYGVLVSACTNPKMVSALTIFFLFVIALKGIFASLETGDSLKANGCCFSGIFNVGDFLIDELLRDRVKDADELLWRKVFACCFSALNPVEATLKEEFL